MNQNITGVVRAQSICKMSVHTSMNEMCIYYQSKVINSSIIIPPKKFKEDDREEMKYYFTKLMLILYDLMVELTYAFLLMIDKIKINTCRKINTFHTCRKINQNRENS